MNEWELLAAAAVGLSLAAAVFSVFVPVRLAGKFEAGPGVKPVVDALLDFGPVALGVASVEGSVRRARFSFYLFSYRVFSFESELPEKEKEESRPLADTRETLGKVLGAFRAYDSRIGAWDTLRFVIRERRRVVIEDLAGRVRYGFEDYALTGELSGYLWALRGLLGPTFNLHHEPDWSGKSVLAGAVRVRLRAYPALMAIDGGLFVLARLRVRGAPRKIGARAHA